MPTRLLVGHVMLGVAAERETAGSRRRRSPAAAVRAPVDRGAAPPPAGARRGGGHRPQAGAGVAARRGRPHPRGRRARVVTPAWRAMAMFRTEARSSRRSQRVPAPGRPARRGARSRRLHHLPVARLPVPPRGRRLAPAFTEKMATYRTTSTAARSSSIRRRPALADPTSHPSSPTPAGHGEAACPVLHRLERRQRPVPPLPRAGLGGWRRRRPGRRRRGWCYPDWQRGLEPGRSAPAEGRRVRAPSPRCARSISAARRAPRIRPPTARPRDPRRCRTVGRGRRAR